MPQQIKMFIPSGNVNLVQTRSVPNFANSVQGLQSKSVTSLSSSFISRVHDFKPGCSSCGKRNF